MQLVEMFFFWQTGHSVLSLLVLGRRKTETLGGLGKVSSELVSSDLARDLDKTRHYEHHDCDDDDDDDDDNDDDDSDDNDGDDDKELLRMSENHVDDKPTES